MAATFSIVKELTTISRDKGSKRLLVALYESADGERTNRYIATSEQKLTTNDQWVGVMKGITIRKSEVNEVIKALQSADFDSAPDTSGLDNKSYADQFFTLPSATTCTCKYSWCLTCNQPCAS